MTRSMLLARRLVAFDTDGGAAAASAATDKAAADKAAADAAAATSAAEAARVAAAAAQTPEQKAAADKAVADKAAADAAAAAAAKAAAGAPEKYDLKLPENSVLDATALERTAATARELGLSNEAAQKVTEFLASEVAANRTATLAAYAQGGAEWTKQDAQWRKDALAHPDLGANKPEQLTASVDLAKRVLAKFGDEQSIGFLETSGLGSHPAALALLVKIGKAMGEGSLVIQQGTGSGSKTPEQAAKDFYAAGAAGAKS